MFGVGWFLFGGGFGVSVGLDVSFLLCMFADCLGWYFWLLMLHRLFVAFDSMGCFEILF